MKKLIAAIVILLFFHTCYSCTCVPMLDKHGNIRPVKQEIKSYDLIVTGKILNIDTIKILLPYFIKDIPIDSVEQYYVMQYLVRIKVEKIYKGKFYSDTMEILTGLGNGDCGYGFTLNSTYTIYAIRKNYYDLDITNSSAALVQKNYYTTSVCDRTTENIITEDKILCKILKL